MKNTYLFHFTRRPSPLFVTASLMSIGALLPANAQQVKTQPNIIFFMVDDMGWQDTSLPFADSITANNRKYDTPNMERLAAEGMMFTDAYATPISSPSRCSLMTGMNMARHRVTNWTLHRDQMTDGKRDGVTLPDWNYNGIAQSGNVGHTAKAISFVQLLKNAGYHTIHCGKAHWGAIDTPGENPCHFGFDTNITGTAAGGLATYLSERNYGFTKDGKPTSSFAIPGLERYWGTGIFATEALTREAIAALEKAKKYDQPFYLYMSHYAVHVPIDRDMRFYPTYRLEEGETLDDILVEAFATVREASWRILRMRPFHVQVMGGIALHQGKIAEMKTGEGKTLVATMPSYLRALTGKGVHVVTVNDYLAKYQSDIMSRVYNFLGLTSGCILVGQTPAERREMYACDITYGTNNEFGFDYLRDNMAWTVEEQVQRGHNFAIIDEVD